MAQVRVMHSHQAVQTVCQKCSALNSRRSKISAIDLLQVFAGTSAVFSSSSLSPDCSLPRSVLNCLKGASVFPTRFATPFVGSPLHGHRLSFLFAHCSSDLVGGGFVKVRRFKGIAHAALGETKTAGETAGVERVPQKEGSSASPANGATSHEDFPSGELEYKKLEGFDSFLVQLKMLVAWPWQRVKNGSVLKMKLSGQIAEQFEGRFARSVSLPQVCQNLIKAANDPRIAGVFLQIQPLNCGWGKIDEIRRHIEYFKKSGKFMVGYLSVSGEKEYYLACACGELYAPPGAYITLLGLKVQGTFLGGVLEKVGVEPQIERIGKYKSAGDSLSRKDMSEANREMLTALLDDIYENWLEKIAHSTGKTKDDVVQLLEDGIFEIERLKEAGWITDIKYEDEVETMLKDRMGARADKPLRTVDYKKYSRVRESTVGLSGGKDRIAVLRAVGSISRTRGGGLNVSNEGIYSDLFIEKIRQVREAKHYKAVVLRIDSPGGDALASDLMWRELKLLAEKKPLVASMADVAASGGYYMAMAAGVIVAENLTLTGSIGVVTGKFNLKDLYERVGYAKEVISRGKFAELDADQRPFKPFEEEYFKRSAMNAYKSFRDKAALSRSMEVDGMEDVAQGRVWTGKAASARGLVDTIGGFLKAVAIAKQKAGIPEGNKVTLVELSRVQASPLQLIRGGAAMLSLLFEIASNESRVELLSNVVKGTLSLAEMGTLSPQEVQARMDDISIDGFGNGDGLLDMTALSLAKRLAEEIAE